MARSNISRLVDKTTLAEHQYMVGTDYFPRIKLEAAARDLKLVEIGEERGAREEPAADETEFDEVEERIIDYVQNKRAESQATFEQHRGTYIQRLSRQALHDLVSEIDDLSKIASSDIETMAEKAEDFRTERGRELLAARDEYRRFRAENQLEREAVYPKSLTEAYGRWVVLLVILGLEAGFNTQFLEVGSETGRLGGLIESVIIASLNILIGLLAGRFPARWIVHRTSSTRAWGYLFLAVWAVVAVVFNLGVGHYRDAMEALAADPQAVARANLMSDPLGLASLRSMVMFVVGVFFSAAALWDARGMDDRYPGYGRVAARYDVAKQGYLNARADLLDEVNQRYQDAVEKMGDRARQLEKRREEGDQIKVGLANLKTAYKAQLSSLESAANGLLQIYRDANKRKRPARTTPPSFKRKFKFDDAPVDELEIVEIAPEQLRKLVAAARRNQAAGQKRLDAARAAAVEGFVPLEQVEA